jgi:hypothetical protein
MRAFIPRERPEVEIPGIIRPTLFVLLIIRCGANKVSSQIQFTKRVRAGINKLSTLGTKLTENVPGGMKLPTRKCAPEGRRVNREARIVNRHVAMSFVNEAFNSQGDLHGKQRAR